MKILLGNIFDSKCSTLVNTVNCVGVMGKGIALEFKKNTLICLVNTSCSAKKEKYSLDIPTFIVIWPVLP